MSGGGVEVLIVETHTHGRALLRRGGSPAAGTLVGFHGYAESAAHQMERLAGIPGTTRWNLVAIQGLHRFYRAPTQVVASWMTREDRLLAIADNIAYVDRALDAATAGTTGPLVCAGFSQGVAMAFRAAVRGRRRASGVIAVGGDVPPELLEDPDTIFPDVLLVRGTADAHYTHELMSRDAAALSARGVRSWTRTVSGGHEWTAGVSAAAASFLAGIGENGAAASAGEPL